MNTMTEIAALEAEFAHLDQGAYDPNREPVEGDIVAIVSGPYEENLGKLLRVKAVYSQVWGTPIDDDNTIVYSDGFSRYMESGVGEIVMMDRYDIKVVA